MSTNVDVVAARAAAMQAELAPMSYAEAAAWAVGHFVDGAGFDAVVSALLRNPDGTPSDPATAAAHLVAWSQFISEYAALLTTKASAPKGTT